MTTRTVIPKLDVPRGAIPWRKKEVILDGETTYTTSTPISDAAEDAADDAHITIGPGTYSEAARFTNDNMTIEGAGRATVIDASTISHAVSLEGVQITLRNLAVKTTQGQGNAYAGVIIPNNVSAKECVVENVVVLESDDDGILLDDGDDHQVRGCIVYNTVDGDAFGNSSTAADAKFANCHAFGTGTDGYIIDGDKTVLVSCWSGGAGDDAFSIGGENNRLLGCTGQSPTSDAVHVKPGAIRCQIIGLSSLSPGGEDVNDNGTETMLEGRYVTPPTENLGGENGSISPTDNNLEHYRLKVDAGGSNTDLKGIDGIAEIGTEVTLIHTGGENVVIKDDSVSATNPFKTLSGGDLTLDANDEMAKFFYDGTVWREEWDNTQA